MNETVLFMIGTVIFFAVATAVFLYGLAVFRELQDRDETDTRNWDAEHPSVTQELGNLASAAPDLGSSSPSVTHT